MGWSIGYDDYWERDIGYGVPATCDHPECNASIHRGLSYVCGNEPYGGEYGCGLHFCGKHLQCSEVSEESDQVCERCAVSAEPFSPKADTDEWARHKLDDPSWGPWRSKFPEKAALLKARFA